MVKGKHHLERPPCKRTHSVAEIVGHANTATQLTMLEWFRKAVAKFKGKVAVVMMQGLYTTV